jgi:hypothetical protein
MKKFRIRKMWGSVAALVVVIAVAVPVFWVLPAGAQDEAIDVTCIKMEDGGEFTMGTMTANLPENVGKDCNATFYDCDDKCVGCYYDQKLDRNICFDKSGKRVVK